MKLMLTEIESRSANTPYQLFLSLKNMVCPPGNMDENDVYQIVNSLKLHPLYKILAEFYAEGVDVVLPRKLALADNYV